jgi:membrane protease YdiL (CAAX protease family)
MSIPSNPLLEPDEGIPDPTALEYGISSQPAPIAQFEPATAGPRAAIFPAWSWWDVLAVLGFTIFTVFLFSIVALAIARTIPEYKRIPVADLATDARIVVGAQATAYPVVLVLIFVVVRTRAGQRFRDAIHWHWPGVFAYGYVVGGVILALVIEGLSTFLPIPKSLPMDNYFHNASSAYLLAAFGITLAPLLEEVFFRGMLYPLMRRAFGLAIAVLLTAVAFAAIHGAQLGYAWSPILSIFVVGIVLTVVRARTNSVASSFLVHCGYNFTLFTALWIASDHFRHLEKVTG